MQLWCRNAVEKGVFQMVYTNEEGIMDSSSRSGLAGISLSFIEDGTELSLI